MKYQKNKKNKKEKIAYYKRIDLIRILACLAVLLYHLNILKGGYLAVCTFFVLNGYLSCISAFKKEKFSFLSYYKNRLLHIYLPLIVVVFISIFVISFISNINWLNLKPETTSILLGYNNFWQLNANLDYFARHIDSPFMHLWYISILLQFDLIFPFLFFALRKIGDKVHKMIPCILTMLFTILGAIYFYKINLQQGVMIAYYHTFTRVFSLFLGLSMGFIHSYYGSFSLKFFQKKSNVLFILYFIILLGFFIFVDVSSFYYPMSMILVTFITSRCIEYSVINPIKTLSMLDRCIKSLAKVSYEIYLVQYPILFLSQYIIVSKYVVFPVLLSGIFLISYLLHFCISHKEKSFRIAQMILGIFFLTLSICGAYQYIMAKDYTMEMKNLEEQLEYNEKIMQEKQEQYASNLKQEEEDWNSILESLEKDENTLKNKVHNLQVVGIGDSVMLGALNQLYQQFPNGYFDAKISRTAWVANGILQSLKNKNMLGDPIILNLGVNGDCPESCKIEIMETCKNHKVFWINATNDQDVHVNDKLNTLARKYSNLYIIDWNSISKGHSEYFIADGIHLTAQGITAYTKTIYDAIYQVYSQEYEKKKEEIIQSHEEEMKTKIDFYGNDLLLNAFDFIQEDFKTDQFIIKNFDYTTLKEEIEMAIQNNSLAYKVVFALDNTISLSVEEYQELIKLCENHNIYIVDIDGNLRDLNSSNVTIVPFYEEIKSYLMMDGIHLTQEGNQILRQNLMDVLIENP